MYPPFNSLSQPNAYGNMKSSVPSKKVDLLLFKFVKCDRTTFDAPASLAVDDRVRLGGSSLPGVTCMDWP